MTVFKSKANHTLKETSLAFPIRTILITVFSVAGHVGKELRIRYSRKSFINKAFPKRTGFKIQ